MPLINIDLSVESCEDGEKKRQVVSRQSNRCNPINVHKEQDYILNITLKRKHKSNNLKAHCPMFQKGKDEGWFVVLGNISDRELYALKRVSGINEQRKSHELQFTTPSKLGDLISAMHVYLYA